MCLVAERNRLVRLRESFGPHWSRERNRKRKKLFSSVNLRKAGSRKIFPFVAGCYLQGKPTAGRGQKSAYGKRFRLTFHQPSSASDPLFFRDRCATGVPKTWNYCSIKEPLSSLIVQAISRREPGSLGRGAGSQVLHRETHGRQAAS